MLTGPFIVTGTNSCGLTDPAPESKAIAFLNLKDYLPTNSLLYRAWFASVTSVPAFNPATDVPNDPESDRLIAKLVASNEVVTLDWSPGTGVPTSLNVALRSECLRIPHANFDWDYEPPVPGGGEWLAPPLPASYEGFGTLASYPTEVAIGDGQDHHDFLIVLDDDTRLPTDVFTYYQRFPRDLAANTWHANGGQHYDLRTGAQPPFLSNGIDSANSPYALGFPHYDRVMQPGGLDQATRITQYTNMNRSSRATNPARGCSSAGSVDGFPFGSRVRLTQAAYDFFQARAGSNPQCWGLAQGWRRHGCIVCDNSGHGERFYCWDDPRWNPADLALLAGLTADHFEVVEMSRNLRVVSGPSTLAVGQAGTWTLRKDPPDDTGYYAYACIYGPDDPTEVRDPLVGLQLSDGPVGATEVTLNWTPTAPGYYHFGAASNGWYSGNTVQPGFLAIPAESTLCLRTAGGALVLKASG
jgi:hypothetical protein